MRFHLTLVRMVIIKKNMINANEDSETREFIYYWWNVK
jgi:hypothetical protein